MRRVVQLVSESGVPDPHWSAPKLIALCDDGTIWWSTVGSGYWTRQGGPPNNSVIITREALAMVREVLKMCVLDEIPFPDDPRADLDREARATLIRLSTELMRGI